MSREGKKAADATLKMLAGVPLFSGCTDDELKQISRLGTILSTSAGTHLTTQGGAGHEFILIRSGHADCVRDGKVVATFGPGDFFGELALLDGGARTATVVANDDVEILVLSHGEFNDLLDRAPSIARKLLVELASRERRVFADSVTQ
jgi:CRP/FNR family cyclic AMP-dependent transcriptional regulator